MTSPGLISCGYQTRTAGSLIEILLRRHVNVLADVRLTPMSRTKGLTKRALAGHLSDAGIEYLHFPALGNPKDNRAGFAKGDPEAAKRYWTMLEQSQAMLDLDRLSSIACESVVAVMCFELLEEHCHRRVLLEELASRNAAILPPI